MPILRTAATHIPTHTIRRRRVRFQRRRLAARLRHDPVERDGVGAPEPCGAAQSAPGAFRGRSTASFSAAVPALASNSHLCRPTWLFSEKRSSDNARTIGLAESRPESEHRSLHMTRARQRTARSAHRPRRSRARGTARCAHLVRAINVPRRAKSRQAGAIDPFSIDEPEEVEARSGKKRYAFSE